MSLTITRSGREVLLPGSDPAGKHRAGNALELEHHRDRRAALVTAAAKRRFSDQELARSRRVTEASGHIHGVSPDAEGAGVPWVGH